MPNKINPEIEKYIINLYQSGFGTVEISEKYKLHRSTIQRVLRRNNIPLRKVMPKIFYNVNFFDEFTPESCYWAGFIAADGYIRSDRNCVTVHLSVRDYEHLEKLAYMTGYAGNPNTNGDSCILSFNGKWFVKALERNFGIKPRKTFDICIPETIPYDMLRFFIRGYFDGDGFITKSGGYVHIGITSGSNEMLEQIGNFFYDNGVVLRNDTGKPPIQESSKAINYGCTNAIKALDLLYKDSTPVTRLDRKYQLYLKFKGEYENVCN